MSLVLDTSVVISISNNDKKIISKIDDLRKIYPNLPSIPFISYFEFLYGIAKKIPKNKERYLQFIENFSLLPMTKTTARVMVELRTKYEKAGLPLKLTYIMVASQVIENKMILITADKDFKTIEELDKIII